MIKRLLLKLERQETEDRFEYSITIVDNDINQTGRQVVEGFGRESLISVNYHVESEQNIALARNKAVENAKGDFIAFIDDDEYPVSNWLLNLYKVYNKYDSGGILGPVLPHFEGNPPGWLIRGKFCERKSHDTGKLLHWDETRSGNVLFDKKIFDVKKCKFDPKFGRSGGEDIDFFKKAIKAGYRFIWCNEAPVYETVPAERWKVSFYLRRNLRIGGLNGERKRGENGKFRLFIKVTIATLLYFVILPISIFAGRHQFLKYLFKLTYNLGWFAGFLWSPILRNRKNVQN